MFDSTDHSTATDMSEVLAKISDDFEYATKLVASGYFSLTNRKLAQYRNTDRRDVLPPATMALALFNICTYYRPDASILPDIHNSLVWWYNNTSQPANELLIAMVAAQIGVQYTGIHCEIWTTIPAAFLKSHKAGLNAKSFRLLPKDVRSFFIDDTNTAQPYRFFGHWVCTNIGLIPSDWSRVVSEIRKTATTDVLNSDYGDLVTSGLRSLTSVSSEARVLLNEVSDVKTRFTTPTFIILRTPSSPPASAPKAAPVTAARSTTPAPSTPPPKSTASSTTPTPSTRDWAPKESHPSNTSSTSRATSSTSSTTSTRTTPVPSSTTSSTTTSYNNSRQTSQPPSSNSRNTSSPTSTAPSSKPPSTVSSANPGKPRLDLTEESFGEIIQNPVEIAEGGFGKVYKGTWNRQTVAVKKVDGLTGCSMKTLQVVSKELKMLQNMRHNNTVILLHAFQDKGSVYFVMHFYERSLLNILNTFPAMQAETFFRLAEGIMSALVYLHNHNPPVVHLDLKPDNIMIEGDQEVRWSAKLSDFGLSKVTSSSSQSTTAKNTGNWMYSDPVLSLEVIHPITVQNDMWSLGVVLWQMIEREEPYISIGHGRILTPQQKLATKLQFTSNQDIPPALHTFINTLWDSEPEKRPTSHQALDIIQQVKDECVGTWVIQ